MISAEKIFLELQNFVKQQNMFGKTFVKTFQVIYLKYHSAKNLISNSDKIFKGYFLQNVSYLKMQRLFNTSKFCYKPNVAIVGILLQDILHGRRQKKST